MRYNKLWVKKIGISILLAVILVGCHKEEIKEEIKEEVINQDDIVMSNGFTVKENVEYAIFYDISSNQNILKIDPYQEIEFYNAPMLERNIAVHNYMIWEYTIDDVGEATFTEEEGDKYAQETLDQLAKMREVCNSYGFTNENRLTSEWVIENQKEALELRQAYIDLKLYWISESMISLYERFIKDKE
ncbi:hypothetical protein EDC19_1695 [Natranaerovirga hydrolytica]|uniref:Uncharacterized protein n=1 Tax=Natranaerovirga hydrolytica TaxID=680378 RepID=A0A4V2Q061_9FIRM|nr:hypothetical protein [Natranaerovirga hydrolytica]TCK92551.1 hypothetical protein EDC19_1695 [Natranaerovirga hydrolytica]